MHKIDGTFTVLQVIYDSRHNLFNESCDKTAKENRVLEWKKVLRVCQMLGVIPSNKDYVYVRDVFWANLKKHTLAKRDAKLSGSPGVHFSPLDLVILEILGEEETVRGELNVADIFAYANRRLAERKAKKNENKKTRVKDVSPLTKQKLEKLNMDQPPKDTKSEISDEQLASERRLELEYLELKTYRLKLELMELEYKLNLEPSEFTREVTIAPVLPKKGNARLTIKSEGKGEHVWETFS